MAAWVIVRNKSKFSNFIYYCFIAMMVVPFQVVMDIDKIHFYDPETTKAID